MTDVISLSQTLSDDGVRLWVDDQLVIDHWTNHSSTVDSSAPLWLESGRRYNIRMEYYENNGGAVAKLMWSSGIQPLAVIPTSQLYPLTIPSINPLPLDSNDFRTGAFTLFGGSSISASTTLAKPNVPSGSRSGNTSMTSTGTDENGVGYTSVTTYSYTFTITSTDLGSGSWEYLVQYHLGLTQWL